MKNNLLWRTAIFAACAVIFFFGACSQTEFDGRIDTVYTLDTPSVTAKAYPGVNIVSWNPVTGAGGYTLSIYEEGFCIKSEADIGNNNYYIDSNLLNGKKYTYYVEARSLTNPATFADRGVYAKNSRGEASATAIVPPADTKSLDLPAYEDGYDGATRKSVSENDQWIVNDSNIKVNTVDGKVTVNFPMKAYLEYDVVFYSNNFSFDSDGTTSMPKTVRNIQSNNTIGHVEYDAPENNYKVAIVARSLNEKYAANDGTKLNISDTPYIYAEYTNQSSMIDRSVRLKIRKLTNKDYAYISQDWYKIYRIDEDDGTPDYSFYSSSFYEADDYGYYYLDDTVPDVTHSYRYVLVITNGIDRSQETYTLEGKIPGNLENDISFMYYDNTNSYMNWRVILYNDAQSAYLTAYYLVVEGESYDEVTADKIKYNGNGCYINDYSIGYDSSIKTISFIPDLSDSSQVTVYVLVEADLYPYESVSIIRSATYYAN